MAFKLRLHIRIDDMSDGQIYRFENEQSIIVQDIENNKLHRIEMINGVFNTQEITITDRAIVEVGDPVPYSKT